MEIFALMMSGAWALYALYVGEKSRRNGFVKRRKFLGNQYRESGYVQVFRSEQPILYWSLTSMYYVIGIGAFAAIAYLIIFKQHKL
jgi:hypothetical protein